MNTSSLRTYQMLLSKNITICQENQQIINNNFYERDGRRVTFSHSPEEQQTVEAVTPDILQKLQNGEISFPADFHFSSKCNIQVVNAESLRHRTELVMNFANAVNPGGGYLRGAIAQEECLCRESTLYASISSPAASEMYLANQKNREVFDTDYLLISPCVDVFRDPSLALLENPYTIAVLTAAAPNLHGKAAAASPDEVEQHMKKRIRQCLLCGSYYGYRTITLGAWGCGAFGNDAKDVARYFKEVLIDEKYWKYYDKILFAIYVTGSWYNFNAFQEMFAEYR